MADDVLLNIAVHDYQRLDDFLDFTKVLLSSDVPPQP